MNISADRLAPVVEAQLALAHERLITIGAGPTCELDLKNLRAFLVNILELVAPDDAIDRAVDEVYAAAVELQAAHRRPAPSTLLRRARAADRAYATLRAALMRAKPSPRARPLW